MSIARKDFSCRFIVTVSGSSRAIGNSPTFAEQTAESVLQTISDLIQIQHPQVKVTFKKLDK